MDFLKSIFGGIGAGTNMFDSFLHPEKGYQEAEEQLKKYLEQAGQVQQPWIQRGEQQYPNLVNAENNLLDPSKLLAEWMSKYEQSPYAKKSFENARESGLNAVQSMGLGGSSAAVNNIQQSSSDIMNADRQAFLQDLMQKYMAGIGIGQNIYGTGATMAGNYGNQIYEAGRDIAGARGNAINAPGQTFGNLLNTGLNLAFGKPGDVNGNRRNNQNNSIAA